MNRVNLAITAIAVVTCHAISASGLFAQPGPEMEQLILKHLQPAPEDLRALASQRAAAVRNQLENVGKVPRERLFLVEPKLTADDIKDQGAKTRVDFVLK